jgi:molybdate/tungstate transport system permease protein
MTLIASLIALFIVAPIISMFVHTSVPDLLETWTDIDVQRSIWITLLTAFAATTFFGLMGIPLAFLLARNDFRGKRIVLGLIDLPIVIPHTAAGIALLGFISKKSTMGKLASAVGIDFVGHTPGIAIAMAFVSIPFLLNAARNGFEAVPERLEKTALSLGTSPARVFFTISLPLAKKSILSGLVMMFARGMSEFGAIVIIAYHPMTTPVLIFERFGAYGLQYARPVAVLFVMVSLIVFILFGMLHSGRNKNER